LVSGVVGGNFKEATERRLGASNKLFRSRKRSASYRSEVREDEFKMPEINL